MLRRIGKSITLSLLALISRAILKKYRPKIVAVTGSVGKSSTKDAIYSVLTGAFRARKSEKSYNSEFGVPLTVIGAHTGWGNPLLWGYILCKGLFVLLFPYRYPEWLVLEVGADKPGDLEHLMRWVTPDITVVTRFPEVPVHVEFYESPEALIREESIPALRVKDGGTLVLNHDDERVRILGEGARPRVVTYGLTTGAEILGSRESIIYKNRIPAGMEFHVTSGNSSIRTVVSGALGIQHIYPVLAAVAVGVSLNIPLSNMEYTLRGHRTPLGRMRIIEGIKNTTLIDDTYNSSPVAVFEALNTLQGISSTGRKIAVLGDMLELGMYSSDEHTKAGEHVARVSDMLVTVGYHSQLIASAALSAGLDESLVFQFDDAREAGRFIQGLLKEGDTILVKGSQSMRMERIVEELMLHPDQKEKLLVRQDKEWLVK